MLGRQLFIAAAAVSIIAGASIGFAFADDQDRDQGATNDQGYSDHWFSSTGYGPSDDQADATRALNREQLENGGVVNERNHGDNRDIQGPSDNDDEAADRNDEEQGEKSPPPPPSDYR